MPPGAEFWVTELGPLALIGTPLPAAGPVKRKQAEIGALAEPRRETRGKPVSPETQSPADGRVKGNPPGPSLGKAPRL